MPRRQRLPLQLQSSSISRGRQIKLLTQYPLYPYNKNKYDRSSYPELSSPATISKSPFSLFSFVFFTPFATLREGKKLLKRWTRLFDALPPSFIIIIFRARMFTRRFEFFSKSKRRRNVCYRYHNIFEIYLGYFRVHNFLVSRLFM